MCKHYVILLNIYLLCFISRYKCIRFNNDNHYNNHHIMIVILKRIFARTLLTYVH